MLGGQCNLASFKYFLFDTVYAEIMPLSLNHRKNRSSVSSVYLACHSAHAEHILEEGLESDVLFFLYF
jgi:hypothetical protein